MKRLKLEILLLVLGLYVLEHFIIYPEVKYRFPIEPIMIIFASYFLIRCSARNQYDS